MTKKLRTSREIYNRIKWDPKFDEHAFVVGVEERFEGLVELPLSELEGPEVHWHRVWYFKRGEEVVWDRQARLDRLNADMQSDTASPAAPTSQPPEEEAPTELSGFRFDAKKKRWTPQTEPPEDEICSGLRAVLYNVLFDQYDAERIRSPQRYEALLALLKVQKADLIVLVEVTPTMLTMVLEQPWVQRRYHVSDDGKCGSVRPYGQLILSRRPFADLRVINTRGNKRAVIAELLLNGRPVELAAVHLISSRAQSPKQRRAEELEVVTRALRAEDAMILGDFNFEEDESAPPEYRDAWVELRPKEPGHTFAPTRNALAALMSTRGIDRRFDRALMRGEGLRPEAISLLGETPIDQAMPPAPELYISDHYGLLLEVDLSARVALADAPPVYRSAVMISPPAALWPPIQAVREQHDPSYERWMPHINLVYGFLDARFFDRAAPELARALDAVEPFEVELTGLRRFDHKRSSSIWIEPKADREGALQTLQSALQDVFPQCDEQGKKSELGFQPHLTIAKVPPSEAPELQSGLQKDFASTRFTVDHVQLIARGDQTPFEVKAKLQLGGPKRLCLAGPDPRPIAEEIETALVSLGVQVEVFGSAKLGVHGPDSDLDLLATSPLATPEFFAQAEALLTARFGPARLAGAAKVAVLRFEANGRSVELSHAQDRFGEDSAEALQAKSGPLEAQAILQCVGKKQDVFRAALQIARRFAKARGLLGHALGLLPPHALALAMLKATQASPSKTDVRALLGRFFDTLIEHPWPEPLCVTEAGERPVDPKAPMPIITMVEPFKNCASNILESTRALLLDELSRGRAVLQKIERGHAPWEALLEPPAPHDGPCVRFLIGADRELALGKLRGQWMALMLELDRAGAAPRPYPELVQSAEGVSLVIGMRKAPMAIKALLRRFEHRMGVDPSIEVRLEESSTDRGRS